MPDPAIPEDPITNDNLEDFEQIKQYIDEVDNLLKEIYGGGQCKR
jgi:hypothetical protein